MRKVKINNPRYPHDIKISRFDYVDRYSEKITETLLWQGKGRCYTNGTIEGRNVDNSHRFLSIPVRFDEWTNNRPTNGDTVTVKQGFVTETMTVKDVEPDNNRTVIYCERNGNADL